MKRLLAVISLVAFFGVLTAPVFATDNSFPVVVNDDKPKKKCDTKSEEKKDCNVPCCEKKTAVPCCEKKKAECDKEKK